MPIEPKKPRKPMQGKTPEKSRAKHSPKRYNFFSLGRKAVILGSEKNKETISKAVNTWWQGSPVIKSHFNTREDFAQALTSKVADSLDYFMPREGMAPAMLTTALERLVFREADSAGRSFHRQLSRQ